jgi:hypothetical protein
MSIKTLKATVTLEIRADIDDNDSVREALKDALEEAIEDDLLDYEVEETEDFD